MTVPVEKTRQRQDSSLLDASASAVAPEAATEASGKGSRSTSEVARKRMYPAGIHDTRSSRPEKMSTQIGPDQSWWKKVRCVNETESGGGVANQGISRANAAACGLWTKY